MDQRDWSKLLIPALLLVLAACDGRPAGSCTSVQSAERRAALIGRAASADPVALQAFYQAARDDDIATLERLIDAGTDVNAAAANLVLDRRDGYSVETGGATALLLAANHGHFAAVDALVCAGADLDRVTQRGDSALHRAVERDAVDIVAYLLAHGARTNPPMPEWSGFTGTALHTAAARGNGEVVAMLLEAGADADVEAMGLTPLDMARDDEVVALLRGHSSKPVKAERELDRLTLHDAAIAGNVRQLRSLLARGRDPDRRDPTGATPILYAASGGHSELVELLLDAGAAPDVADDAGETPLIRAVVTRRPEIVEMLLAHGADPQATDFRGRPALEIAQSDRVRAALQAALPAPEPRPSGWLARQAPETVDGVAPAGAEARQSTAQSRLTDEQRERLRGLQREFQRLLRDGAEPEEVEAVTDRLLELQAEIVAGATPEAPASTAEPAEPAGLY